VNDLSEAAGRRFTEGANESYRLVGAFCPWYLSGAVAKRMKLKLVSAKSENGSAATLSKGRLAHSI
jgi:hypothetical protein